MGYFSKKYVLDPPPSHLVWIFTGMSNSRNKQGVWGYDAAWGSFRYKEMASGISRGCIKTMWDFSGVIKKKSCENFRGLGFRHYNLKWELGVIQNFVEFT